MPDSKESNTNEDELTLEDCFILVLGNLTELHHYLDGIADAERKITETANALDTLHKVQVAVERFAVAVCPAELFPDRGQRWPRLFGAAHHEGT